MSIVRNLFVAMIPSTLILSRTNQRMIARTAIMLTSAALLALVKNPKINVLSRKSPQTPTNIALMSLPVLYSVYDALYSLFVAPRMIAWNDQAVKNTAELQAGPAAMENEQPQVDNEVVDEVLETWRTGEQRLLDAEVALERMEDLQEIPEQRLIAIQRQLAWVRGRLRDLRQQREQGQNIAQDEIVAPEDVRVNEEAANEEAANEEAANEEAVNEEVVIADADLANGEIRRDGFGVNVELGQWNYRGVGHAFLKRDNSITVMGALALPILSGIAGE